MMEKPNGIVYIKFNNRMYNLYVELENEAFIPKVIELLYEKREREGDIVKYDGDNDGIKEDWIILYNYGENVEIVSVNTMGDLTLGANDEQAQGSTNLEKAIYSYNNAIERLNNYCESLVTNPNKISVRSIGSNPDNFKNENNNPYRSEFLVGTEYNGIGKSKDMNFEKDYACLLYNDCIVSDKTYWLASRYMNRSSWFARNSLNFCITNAWIDSETGEFNYLNDYNVLWGVYERENNGVVSKLVATESRTYGVRPVVKVSSDSV